MTCQANYILPTELNVNLLIHQISDKYKLNDLVYFKLEKCLTRISNEILTKYNPVFYKEPKIDDIQKNKSIQQIIQFIKNKNINIDILNIINQSNLNGLNSIDYHTELKKILYKSIYDNNDLTYKDKLELFHILENIDNRLIIKNECNKEKKIFDVVYCWDRIMNFIMFLKNYNYIINKNVK